MLVLTRKAGESIKIGENITVVITQIRGDRARIGIEAPAEIPIVRTELGVLQSPERRSPAVPTDPPSAKSETPPAAD